MPRPNRQRMVLAEDHLAMRIAAERDARGWTNDGLAKRMTDAGCAMTGSAIFKIEKAEPRRRIVVDELVAFSKVFGIPMDELLLPPEVALSKELGRLVIEWNYADEATRDAERQRDAAWGAIRAFVADHPEAEKALEPILATWAEHYFDPAHHSGAVAYRMYEATGDERWADKVRSSIEDRAVD